MISVEKHKIILIDDIKAAWKYEAEEYEHYQTCCNFLCVIREDIDNLRRLKAQGIMEEEDLERELQSLIRDEQRIIEEEKEVMGHIAEIDSHIAKIKKLLIDLDQQTVCREATNPED